MKSVEDALITLGGFGGTGFTWLDLVFGGVGFLASIGAFSYVAALFKSAFIKTAIVSSITAGTDIGNEFKDKFVEAGYTTITEANAENAFKNVSNEKLLAFLWDNYSERTQVINIKKHIENGAKTYFQNIGGTYNVASAVPQNLFRTMFENQCGFKNNVYVPDLFFGAAFVATNVINHNYYPGAFSLNMLKSNVDTINTNVNTLTTNVNNLQVYLNTPPATFNIYIDDADYLGNIYLFGDDRSGTFVYGTSKRLIKVNDGDTVNIFLSSTIIAWTNLAGLTDIAVLITFNGVTNWEAYAGDQRRSTISYTLKSTDSLQIKTGWWGPSINDPLYSGMLDPVNFSIKETINSVYYTKSQIDSKGYLTAIPSEYITETELTTAHYTKTQIDTNIYTKTQIIKLQNGTDLIANVALNSAEEYVLEEPMEFNIDIRGRGETGLVMRHWLPVQLLKKNSISIKTKDVLSVMEPEDEFCEYYLNTVYKIKELLKAKSLVDDMDDDEIQDMLDDFEDLRSDGDTIH